MYTYVHSAVIIKYETTVFAKVLYKVINDYMKNKIYSHIKCSIYAKLHTYWNKITGKINANIGMK